MPQRSRALVLVGRVVMGLLVVAFFVLVATLGGFLNHCRGGYVHFGPETSVSAQWYWLQHILGRLLFAVPTGLVVILFGFHLKGALVVMLMTWFSLYVGWVSYINIGMDNSYCSRAGAFDWLIGRQAQNWSETERFVREYSGMSLRGLIWTLPQGYALEQMGFGWEYSLTGSVMPLVYYIGANTNTARVHDHRMHKLMDSTPAVSELMWGMWVWFVLITCCASQAVRRARIWIYKRNPHLGFKPFSAMEKVKYESMNRTVLRVFYDSLVTILTLLYCFTVIYYSVVVQPDVRNKGQTFFGLFTGVLFLVFSQAWIWGTRYRSFVLKRYARKLRGRSRTNNAIYNNNNNSSMQISEESDSSAELARTAQIASSEIDHSEGISAALQSASPASPSPPPKHNQGPMLSWPYSHPDRLSPTGEQRQQVLDMSERLYPPSMSYRSTFMVIWIKLEKMMWLDVFILTRRIIGAVSLICTIFSMMITVTATVVGWNNARFLQDLDPPCYS